MVTCIVVVLCLVVVHFRLRPMKYQDSHDDRKRRALTRLLTFTVEPPKRRLW